MILTIPFFLLVTAISLSPSTLWCMKEITKNSRSNTSSFQEINQLSLNEEQMLVLHSKPLQDMMEQVSNPNTPLTFSQKYTCAPKITAQLLELPPQEQKDLLENKLSYLFDIAQFIDCYAIDSLMPLIATFCAKKLQLFLYNSTSDRTLYDNLKDLTPPFQKKIAKKLLEARPEFRILTLREAHFFKEPKEYHLPTSIIPTCATFIPETSCLAIGGKFTRNGNHEDTCLSKLYFQENRLDIYQFSQLSKINSIMAANNGSIFAYAPEETIHLSTKLEPIDQKKTTLMEDDTKITLNPHTGDIHIGSKYVTTINAPIHKIAMGQTEFIIHYADSTTPSKSYVSIFGKKDGILRHKHRFHNISGISFSESKKDGTISKILTSPATWQNPVYNLWKIRSNSIETFPLRVSSPHRESSTAQLTPYGIANLSFNTINIFDTKTKERISSVNLNWQTTLDYIIIPRKESLIVIQSDRVTVYPYSKVLQSINNFLNFSNCDQPLAQAFKCLKKYHRSNNAIDSIMRTIDSKKKRSYNPKTSNNHCAPSNKKRRVK